MRFTFISYIIALTSCFQAVAAVKKSCKAIALSGGGSKGAWETGVVWGLYYAGIENNDTSVVEYDVVSGISVGSINGGGMSFYEKGQEEEMVKFMSDVW